MRGEDGRGVSGTQQNKSRPTCQSRKRTHQLAGVALALASFWLGVGIGYQSLLGLGGGKAPDSNLAWSQIGREKLAPQTAEMGLLAFVTNP